jgi:hypothetical protein
VPIKFKGESMAPFPHWLTITFSVIAVLGTVTGVYVAFVKSPATMVKIAENQAPVIGHDIQHNGSGVGQEIINDGGGTGGEVTVTVPPDTSAIGTRVILNGPGVGLRVINSGQGTGFRSTVIVGPK